MHDQGTFTRIKGYLSAGFELKLLCVFPAIVLPLTGANAKGGILVFYFLCQLCSL